ncbi:MAG: hypothetical protein IJW55_08480 [Clostridia bacterium]|nr:hypothetical protein [Clostridia bacterium]
MKKKLLFVLLAVAVLIAAFAIGVFATAETASPTLSIKKASLSLEEDVRVNFKVAFEGLNETEAANVKLLVWKGADEGVDYTQATVDTAGAAVLSVAEAQTIDGVVYQCFQYKDIAAKEMGKTLYARAYYVADAENVIYSDTVRYSVAQYLYSMQIADAQTDEDVAFNALLNSLIAYGNAAQAYFATQNDPDVGPQMAGMYSVSVEGGTFSDGMTAGDFLVGETVTLTVTPAQGYLFDGWNVTDASGAPVTVTDNRFIMPASDVIASATLVVCDHSGSAHTEYTLNDDGTHSFTCTVCGAIHSANCSGGEATCLVGKICESCGFEYDTTKAPDNHVSTEYTYTDNENGIHTEAHKCCGTVTYEYDESTNTYTVYTAKGLYAWNEAARAVISTGTEDTNNDWYAEYTTDMPNLTLAADITLTGENNWTPLGYCVEGDSKDTYYPYIGTIDGNGHTITGLNINSTEDYIAFMGSLGPNSEVKNLTFKDATIIGGNCVATVAADCGGNVTNCHVTGSSSISGNNRVAGVIASNSGIISGCTNAAAVTVTVTVTAGDVNYGSGGVVGINGPNGIVIGCFNSGDITASASNGSHFYGGVVGFNYAESTIIACGNTGKVVASANGVGGIVGANYSVPVYACWTKETTELKSGTEVSSKDGVGIDLDNNNAGVLKACYSFADASAVADAITAMNTVIEEYNASAAEGRKCTYKWQVGTDGYPTLVEIDQTPTE